eukprot:c33404_g1_i1.p1 GENE.c33404_g1_i1~~c33404_g1_i1.p1  ORF type:complete len:254 (+),score=28.34 c33404_g1_i1:164-925(+)
MLVRSLLVAIVSIAAYLLLLQTSSTESSANFTPAAGYHALTQWYDLAVRWTCREELFRPLLAVDIARALSAARPSASAASPPLVLEIGAGTGSLTLELATALAGVAILAVEPDPVSRQIAGAKVQGKSHVRLVEGFGQALPAGNGSVSAVVTSLVLHHLSRESKLATLKESLRVLAPGGSLHIADWGEAQTWLDSALFLPIRALDGFDTTGDNTHGVIPLLVALAGFEDCKEVERVPTVFGPLALWQARSPAK